MSQGPIRDDPRDAIGVLPHEKLVIGCVAVWCAIVVWAWLIAGAVTALIGIMALVLPVALVWVWVVVMRAQRALQGQIADLQQANAALRQLFLAEKVPSAPLPKPAAQQGAGFTTRRDQTSPLAQRSGPVAAGGQKALALETPSDQDNPPLERPDLIRALHFPDNADDAAGFAALRRALRDHGAHRLVQASQDVLTLLAQDGIYMDDLRPDPASADLWRRFAHGERGRSLDQLGAVRDPNILTLVAARMRQDTIFRDAVHHFLRLFDDVLVRFEQDATDADLLKLAETRTARAFMLLGRTSRTFD
jgi:hypothetical protein